MTQIPGTPHRAGTPDVARTPHLTKPPDRPEPAIGVLAAGAPDSDDEGPTDPGPLAVPVAESAAVGSAGPERPGGVRADGHRPIPTRPAGDAEDPRLRLARGVLVSGRYLLTRRLHRDPLHEIWQAVDQTLVRDVRMIVIAATDTRAQAVMEAARRAAMVRDQHFLRVFDADRATVADLTRVWRPGEQDSMRVHPAGAGRSPTRPAEQPPGLAAPLVYVVEEWVPAQPLETLLQRSPLPSRQAVVLALELAEALTAAHAQGMPHGFVGPDRVLVSSGGSVRISGLRSAAVLASRTPAPPGSPAAREQDATDAAADVRSIGAVLYAALTARWPLGGTADVPTESLWRWTPGAAAVAVGTDSDTGDDGGDSRRLRAAPRAHGRVLAPRQVRPGIPRRLDELVLRLLGHAVGDHLAVRTPAEAVELLGRELQAGTERGAALPALRDLADHPTPGGRARPAETRATPAEPPPRTDNRRTEPPRTGSPGTEAAPVEGATAVGVAPGVTALAAGVAARTGATAAGAVDATIVAGRRDAADSSGRAAVATRQRPEQLAWQGAQSRVDLDPGDPGAPGEPIGRVPGDRRAPDLRLSPQPPPRHRWRPVLVFVVVLALLGGALALVLEAKRTLSGQGTNPANLTTSSGTKSSARASGAGASPGASGGTTAAPAGQIVLPIRGATDFDPVTDGGNGTENPDEVGLAIDTNPDTAWRTVTYFGRADLGGLKAGVGLIIDLGSVRRVSSVEVGLTGDGTDVDLRTATGAAAPAALPGFTEVASASHAGSQAQLTPTSAVRARWLLIWLTSLPQTGADSYQGGISSITVRGPRSS